MKRPDMSAARPPSTKHRMVGSLVAGALAVFSATAHADEIAQVNLTSSGPDRELPVGKPFYVAGTAAETTRSVQAILVRKGSPVIGFGGSGPSCLELRRRLGLFSTKAPKAVATGATPDLATLDAGYAVLEPGARDPSLIWAHGEGAALVTAAWERGAAKDAQTFKLLVPGDGEFFRSGYAFCLYVFRVDDTRRSVDQEVANALDAYERAIAACATPTCADDAASKLQGTIKQIGVDAAAVQHLVDAASSLLTQPAAIRRMLKSWRASLDPTAAREPSFVKRVDLPVLIPLAPRPQAAMPGQAMPPDPAERHIPLAAALANALSHHPGGLFATVQNRAMVYYAFSGKSRVAQLGLLEDGSLEVSEGSAASTNPIKPKLDDLALSPAISARDLIELTQGRLQLGGYRTLHDVAANLERSLIAGNSASDGDLANLRTFRGRIQDLAEVMRRAFAASEGFDSDTQRYPDDTRLPDTAERLLGEWLRSQVVEPCGPLSADWAAHKIVAPTCGPNPKAWPGYAQIGATPLDTLANAAADLLDAHDTWSKAKTSLAVSGVQPREERTEARIAFTQETWVGSYLTPLLGYAHAAVADSTLFYTGFQLHGVPNPVDDPQWNHGTDDLPRALAFEIAFAPGAGSFGRDGRYDGPWILPPVFFGIALHPLPYTSVGAGWMLADARSTTLAKQDRHVEAFGYVGLSLQGNLPDLLYKKLGYGFKTSTDK
jgi:hypothetical protein